MCPNKETIQQSAQWRWYHWKPRSLWSPQSLHHLNHFDDQIIRDEYKLLFKVINYKKTKTRLNNMPNNKLHFTLTFPLLLFECLFFVHVGWGTSFSLNIHEHKIHFRNQGSEEIVSTAVKGSIQYKNEGYRTEWRTLLCHNPLNTWNHLIIGLR